MVNMDIVFLGGQILQIVDGVIQIGFELDINLDDITTHQGHQRPAISEKVISRKANFHSCIQRLRCFSFNDLISYYPEISAVFKDTNVLNSALYDLFFLFHNNLSPASTS